MEQEEYFKEFTKDLHSKIVGECKQCGLCCKENWRFAYRMVLGESLEADYQSKPPDRYIPCISFDPKTNLCLDHEEDKVPVCKYWPLLESDLEQISCPGYKITLDKE